MLHVNKVVVTFQSLALFRTTYSKWSIDATQRFKRWEYKEKSLCWPD